jgi:hypothetical protein
VFTVPTLLRVAITFVEVAVSDSADDPFPMTVPVEVAAARSTTVGPAATIVGDGFFSCAHCGAGRGNGAHGESDASGENRAGYGNRHALRKSHGATASKNNRDKRSGVGFLRNLHA